MKSLMRFLTTIVIALISAVAGFTLAFLIDSRNPNDYEMLQDANKFEKLGNQITAYICAHDGEIPADPYGALVGSGSVKSFKDFVFGDRIVTFYMPDLPPRINVELAKNTRAPLLYLAPEGLRELWVYYLDGTWERIPGFPNFGRSFADIQLAWDRTMHKVAGYPYWGSTDAKIAWVQRENHRLVWDANQGMYVVGNQPQRQQAAPASMP